MTNFQCSMTNEKIVLGHRRGLRLWIDVVECVGYRI